MSTHAEEESPSDVNQFALSAVQMVLTLLRERKDTVGCRLHASMVRQSVFLHLIRTFDTRFGLVEKCSKWEMESLLKLYIILWVSIKTEGMNFSAISTEKNISWQMELLQEGKNVENRLAREIFINDSSINDTVYPCYYVDVLMWLIMEVFLPFSHSWEEFNIWKCATDNNNSDNNDNEEEENSHPFIQWTLSILNTPDLTLGAEWQLSPLKQCVVSLVVLLGADRLILSKHPNLFTDAYIRTLVVACTANALPEHFVKLTRSIYSGLIRGDSIYYNDLRVLLETLRRFVSCCDDVYDEHAQKVRTAVDVLLNTSCPLGGDVDITRGVKSVCEWFELLDLDSDYREVLVRGGIDGEVLRSGLTIEDVRQMGIKNERDAAVLLRVLSASPHKE
ncbi:uncharacterized protein TM35_000072280 [Trypanosoma theileri]|uniref:SAM domain-containing protein n=1 Tax=Trypanosoma theileri TaxID=67003 RepID=A0A1X0P1H1_9TRYP|nr:uncharacterized protein TM35_000072280 [Trypanosoma theileri]ORC90804.1 hypothetical protein TM35_000072280 [Trypanosoma theileri]